MYGGAYMHPQPTGISVNLRDFHLLSHHIKHTGKPYHLPFTLECKASGSETVLIPNDYTIMLAITH